MSYAMKTDLMWSSASFSLGVLSITSCCISWLSSTTLIGLGWMFWPSPGCLYFPSRTIFLGSVSTPTAFRMSFIVSFSFCFLSGWDSSVRSGMLQMMIFFFRSSRSVSSSRWSLTALLATWGLGY